MWPTNATSTVCAISAGLAALVLPAPLPAAPASGQPAPTTAGPSVTLVPQVLTLGDTPGTVEVRIADAPPTVGFELSVVFDDLHVALTDVALGPFAGRTGRSVRMLGPDVAIPGLLGLGALTSGDGPLPHGDGVLARLTFSPLDAGEVQLTLDEVLLVGPDGSTTSVPRATGRLRVPAQPPPAVRTRAADETVALGAPRPPAPDAAATAAAAVRDQRAPPRPPGEGSLTLLALLALAALGVLWLSRGRQ